MKISPTDLIINPDGTIYHLNLLPEHLSDTIITVGDPDRVKFVSQYFDSIEIKSSKREFVTHTGYLKGKRLSVISSGIGTDNVEILMNELDALVNINFNTLEVNPVHKSLNIIRLGTSGSLQTSIPVNSFVISAFGIGLDALGFFYETEPNEITKKIRENFELEFMPYGNPSSNNLLKLFSENSPKNWFTGTTITCPGFYAPQGRTLRYMPKIEGLLQKMNQFSHDGIFLTNLEMETAGYYLMGKILGHEVLSISAILASRMTNEFSQIADKQVDSLIKFALEKLCK
ncbi:MAG: nucleoside phosphorylase [Arcicella sp.]|nr:nucleoside phosphorylase [Arcicella sp.]